MFSILPLRAFASSCMTTLNWSLTRMRFNVRVSEVESMATFRSLMLPATPVRPLNSSSE